MTLSEWDLETEKRIKAIWTWALDPNRKPAELMWTAGGERQIGYVVEFVIAREKEQQRADEKKKAEEKA